MTIEKNYYVAIVISKKTSIKPQNHMEAVTEFPFLLFFLTNIFGITGKND